MANTINICIEEMPTLRGQYVIRAAAAICGIPKTVNGKSARNAFASDHIHLGSEEEMLKLFDSLYTFRAIQRDELIVYEAWCEKVKSSILKREAA